MSESVYHDAHFGAQTRFPVPVASGAPHPQQLLPPPPPASPPALLNGRSSPPGLMPMDYAPPGRLPGGFLPHDFTSFDNTIPGLPDDAAMASEIRALEEQLQAKEEDRRRKIDADVSAYQEMNAAHAMRVSSHQHEMLELQRELDLLDDESSDEEPFIRRQTREGVANPVSTGTKRKV
ncbi:hypothetical protein MMC22_000351 [Lobaria immixta]|nr:hypothetical protein [Lobaria immixta]